MTGLMIASPSYGLANRLRLMGSAKIIADVLEKEFRFIWEQNGDMPETRWHDLFEPSPDFVELELAGFRGWLTKVFWRSPFAGPDRLYALGGLPGDRWAAHEKLLGFITDENTPYACVYPGATRPCSTHAECSVAIDPMWKHVGLRGQFNYKLVDMSDEEYVRRMRAFYRGLRPVAAVTEIIDRLTRDFAPQVSIENDGTADIAGPSVSVPVTVGVHFRQTDNTHFYEGAIPAAAYHALMDRAIERFPEARFFVAADTPRAREVTRRRYGDRILTHITESPGMDSRLGDRYARLGQQAALADLIALSRTSIIIGTRFSSFSYVPAVWGGVPVIETGRDLRVIPWT
jgi:hypothetical protein